MLFTYNSLHEGRTVPFAFVNITQSHGCRICVGMGIF